MVDLREGSREAAAVGDAPGEGIEANVERAGGAATRVEVGGAETDDGTESLLPGEMREFDGDFGIGGEHRTCRTGRGLVLVDLEEGRKAAAVIAQVPAGGIMIGGAGERPAAEDEQVAAVMEEIRDSGPGGLWNDRALGEDEEAGLRIAELGGELIGGSDARFRKNLGELGRGGRRGVRGGQSRFGPNNGAGEFLGAKCSGSKERKEECQNKKDPR